MKRKKFGYVCALVFIVFFSFLFSAGCKKEETIKIWVGSEARDFYQRKMDEWVVNYNAANSKPFQGTIIVESVDTGAAAAKFLDDTAVGADIFTIAHDNLGRLIAGASAIGPITDQRLLAQINNDNPFIFLDVIKGSVGEPAVEYTFGVPYIAQALVLYYNKDYLTDEDVKTWEGIWAKARANGKQSVTVNGDDGYNNSFLVLATRESDGTPVAEIYLNKQMESCNFNSDLAVATMQWGQRFFTDSSPDGRINYGAKRVSDSGWEIELANEFSLSLIGGAWNFNAARSALGSKLGIAPLPTFTLTAADVAGTTVPAGTVMKSGTFADTKMFVMKKLVREEDKTAQLQNILLYLSSKEVQEEAFEFCQNLPAYKNASAEFRRVRENTLEGRLAQVQYEMFASGRPQPFGVSARMNNWYYSQGAPGIVLDILTNAKDSNGNSLYDTTAKIREGMAVVETIWKTGRRP
ncbi:MAG: extracellular solute-binding protein [Treponema sp.]|jgi:arabinogalactan oligomer/maltooligosaccharide transport system substrate-binding protein|nr:extracellular solute-binding protein [Treponema sp.]